MKLADPAVKLPVEHLSVSSISLFLRCPEKWRRHYLEPEFEPTSGAALVGGAVHKAEESNFRTKRDLLAVTDIEAAIAAGESLDISAEDVLDLYSDAFDEKREEEEDKGGVEWGSETPGEAKDSGANVLAVYHDVIAPSVRPIEAERKFELRWNGLDWDFIGYLDVEEQDRLVDLKVKGRKPSAGDFESDIQATAGLLARREEGDPISAFDFHCLIRTKTPQAFAVPSPRTEAQLDAFVHRLFAISAEIAWRTEYDIWDGAREPGAWYCSARWCHFHPTCPFGGVR